ncbi:hypothetical protein [Robbsia andropogonis]|uniref:hypothetical protein n=1 Tax=Robbsia andropogonis TaxID=28092 RepID=UPI0004B99232|nr:hypothetical protein [Robbsia andropogonis]MCP1117092.1 hypothetical protein [Robbsia andropogonis]MCP1128438.1 hypothetical protein [Robbsia andropogonis]
MTAIAKFLIRENNVFARSLAYVGAQSRLALRQHLQLCQVVVDAMAQQNAKR